MKNLKHKRILKFFSCSLKFYIPCNKAGDAIRLQPHSFCTQLKLFWKKLHLLKICRALWYNMFPNLFLLGSGMNLFDNHLLLNLPRIYSNHVRQKTLLIQKEKMISFSAFLFTQTVQFWNLFHVQNMIYLHYNLSWYKFWNNSKT